MAWKRWVLSSKGQNTFDETKTNVEFDILVCAEVQQQVHACLYRTGSDKNVYLFWEYFFGMRGSHVAQYLKDITL